MATSNTDSGGAPGAGWLAGDPATTFAGATVLLVEDDPDICELMNTLLELAGFETTTCGTAEAALEALREQQFELVLTDYMLPQRTGGWLLKQAGEEGLIDDTPVIVLTAHPNPPDVSGFDVMAKPFDLDDLIARVRSKLGASGRPPRLPVGRPPERRDSDDGNSFECPGPVELILYVTSDAPGTESAIRTIKDAIARFDPARVRLTICDLSTNPAGGAADTLAFTPAAIDRAPGPRTFILGHVTNSVIVTELLDSCGEPSF